MEVPPLLMVGVVAGLEANSVLVVSGVAISVPFEALATLLDSEVWSSGSWEVWVNVLGVFHVVNVSVLGETVMLSLISDVSDAFLASAVLSITDWVLNKTVVLSLVGNINDAFLSGAVFSITNWVALLAEG